MGYIYELSVALLVSFGGTCSKNIAPYFGPQYISLFRFVFGVLFLLLLKLIKRERFRPDFWSVCKMCSVWLVVGGVSKWLSYVFENYGLAHGPSYGNVIAQPVMLIFLSLVSVFVFKDKLTIKKILAMIVCVIGILILSWNGRPLQDFLESGVLLIVVYTITAIGGALFVLAQKMVGPKMDSIDSNLAMFSIAMFFALMPVAPDVAAGSLVGIRPSIACLIAIPCFGIISGAAFYLNAKALEYIPLYLAALLQNFMVLFSMIWGLLFWGEPITIYMICGAVLFVGGIAVLNLSE